MGGLSRPVLSGLEYIKVRKFSEFLVVQGTLNKIIEKFFPKRNFVAQCNGSRDFLLPFLNIVPRNENLTTKTSRGFGFPQNENLGRKETDCFSLSLSKCFSQKEVLKMSAIVMVSLFLFANTP